MGLAPKNAYISHNASTQHLLLDPSCQVNVHFTSQVQPDDIIRVKSPSRATKDIIQVFYRLKSGCKNQRRVPLNTWQRYKDRYHSNSSNLETQRKPSPLSSIGSGSPLSSSTCNTDRARMHFSAADLAKPGGTDSKSFWMSDDGEGGGGNNIKKLTHSVNKSTKQKTEAVSEATGGWLAALLS